MTNLFYHTPFSADAVMQLQQQQFDNIEPVLLGGADQQLFLVLNKPARKYWITNDTGLADQNELAEAHYEQNILPVTLNEIQQWEN